MSCFADAYKEDTGDMPIIFQTYLTPGFECDATRLQLVVLG